MSEAETLRARICAAILRTHQEIIEVFELWDENGDGTVSRQEFTRGVSRVRCPAPRDPQPRPRPAPTRPAADCVCARAQLIGLRGKKRESVDELFDCLDKEGTGHLEYAGLFSALDPILSMGPKRFRTHCSIL